MPFSKKFFSVFLFGGVFLFLSACQNSEIQAEPKIVDLEKGVSVVDEVDKEAVVEEQKEAEEEVLDIAEATDPQIEVSSVLLDKTAIGFNYEGEMVSDKDFSTAWCPSEAGVGSKISYVFNSPVKSSYFGLVPGFARDEAIYKQNNRIQSLALYFDDVKWKDYELEDLYGMQFLEFGEEKSFKKITIEVTAVYAGSKYPDTCISEWDFWSDYVKNKDVGAALNYYNNYKKKDALKPYDIVGQITVSDIPPAACKEPEPASADVYEKDGVMVYPSYSFLYFTSYINQFGVADQNLDVELYYKGYDEEWYLVDSSFEWPIVESCGGNLYQHIKVSIGLHSAYLLKIYNQGKLVGSKEIATY